MSLQYIIDGYNVTNHPEFRKQLPKFSSDSRVALIQLIKLKKLCGSSNNSVWVIFDGYQDASIDNLDEFNLKVIYSRKESADDRIKKIIERISNPKNVIVISDDKEIKFFVKSCKAKSVSVQNFLCAKNKMAEKAAALVEPEITYSQMHKINEELKKIWLS